MTSNIKFQTNRHTYVCNFQVKMKLQNDLIMNLKLKQHFCSQLRYTRTNRRSDVHGINFFILAIKNNFSKRLRETPSIHRYFIHFFARNCQLSGSYWRHACENPRSIGEEPRKRAQSRFFDFWDRIYGQPSNIFTATFTLAL